MKNGLSFYTLQPSSPARRRGGWSGPILRAIPRRSFRVCCFVLSLTTPCAIAPGQTSALPRFDVASVKPLDKNVVGRSVAFSCSHGRFVSNYSLRYLIKWAWSLDMEDYLLSPLPAWVGSSENYSIEARAASDISEGTCRLMLRDLLKERFRLGLHQERRLVEAYVLLIAKGGSKLTRVTDPVAPPNGPGFTISGYPNQIYDRKLQGWTMQQLAIALHFARLERPVIDQTHLTGIYKIDLKFRSRSGAEDSSDSDPDVTTALKEQLGLELRSSKQIVDMLIVDRLERPDAN
jgi:uncharacterized protein (TIGR03435 family)